MTNWTNLFAHFQQQKALVIGDMMVDSYVFGKVERISPEAPVPVVAVQGRELRLGGAANVALNLKALGLEVSIAAVSGEDGMGAELQKLLTKQHIKTNALIFSSDRKTTVKHRIIGNNVQMLRVDDESTHDLSEEEQDLILEKIKTEINQGVDVVVFEDYDKGLLNPELIKKIISLCQAASIPTVVDPKKKNFLAYAGCTLFKPNLKELKEGLKVELDLKSPEDLRPLVGLLKEKLTTKLVLLTLSEWGLVLADGSEWHHLPAHLRKIADVSGAGDSVISVAAAALAAGAEHKAIAFLANLAGGLVCEHVGVVPIDKQQLLNEALRLDA